VALGLVIDREISPSKRGYVFRYSLRVGSNSGGKIRGVRQPFGMNLVERERLPEGEVVGMIVFRSNGNREIQTDAVFRSVRWRRIFSGIINRTIKPHLSAEVSYTSRTILRKPQILRKLPENQNQREEEE
jgi:hypothetical protein